MSTKEKTEQDYHHIGYVHSEQGVRGELFISLLSEDTPWLDEWNCLHIGEREESLPTQEFTIIEKRPHKKQGRFGMIVQLEGVKNRNDVSAYKGWSVWVPGSFVTSTEGEAIFLHEVLGFRVHDQERGDVGEIIGVESSGLQDYIQVKTDEGTFDVPFVEDFIINLDFDLKIAHMSIPQGLLEEL